MILYFSGTGNSLFIAEELQYLLHEPVLSLNEKIKQKEYRIPATKQYILVFPVYAGRIPRIVADWLDRTPFPNHAKLWCIGTCSHIPGNIDGSLLKMAKRNGLRYCGFDYVFMPQNHITLYTRESDRCAKQMIRAAIDKTERIAAMIRSGQPFRRKHNDIKDHFVSNISYVPFYWFMVGARTFRTINSCTGCGACAKRCPLNNIHLQNGKPVWGNRCTHCMACISLCPQQAIEYGNITVGKKRNRCIRFHKTMLKGAENMLDFITVNTHSSIRIAEERVIYIDPFKITNAPHDADMILITHSHFDHLSPEDIRKVMKPDTVLVCPKSVTEADSLELTVQKVGVQEQFAIGGIEMETVPAYNKLKPFHPKSKGWVGYIINSETHGCIYIAGDTDITEENQQVQCRIAMLPIGGTYTVDAKQAAKLANILRPEYAIPVHYGSVAGKPEDADTFHKLVDSSIQVVLKVQTF